MPLQLSHTSTYAILSIPNHIMPLCTHTSLYTDTFFTWPRPISQSIDSIPHPNPLKPVPHAPTRMNPSWRQAVRWLAEGGTGGGLHCWSRPLLEEGVAGEGVHGGA